MSIEITGLTANRQQTTTNSGTVADTEDSFAALLDEREAELEDTLKKLTKAREEERDFQRALNPEVELIRHIMPDGSTRITRYEDGRLAGTSYQRAHLVPVPDQSRPTPKAADGTELTTQQPQKYVPHMNPLDDLL